MAVAIAAYNGPLAGGAPASQFPAGIDPASCPNFPNCDNPLVAISNDPQSVAQFQPAAPQPQYQQAAQPRYQPQYQQPAPQYQQPAPQYQQAPQPISQYNPVLPNQYQAAPQPQYSPDVQNALDQGKYIGDGDYHGEGVLPIDTLQKNNAYNFPSFVSGLAEAGAPGFAGQAAAPQYQPAQQYQPAPQYQPAAPQYQPAPQYNPAPAAYNPAPAARAYSPAPAAAAQAQPAQIPAGVDANVCPNYPFCH